MDESFFERPILNSPYAYPARHWELDALMDAIESGIVKLPRVPVAENIPGDDMPMFRNLWENIRKDMPRKGRGKAQNLDPLALPTRLQTPWMEPSMSKEVADHIRRNHPGFLADVSYISALFEKADRAALKAAVDTQDFPGLCAALKVDQGWLETLLKQSGVRAETMFNQDTSLAETLQRQQPKE